MLVHAYEGTKACYSVFHYLVAFIMPALQRWDMEPGALGQSVLLAAVSYHSSTAVSCCRILYSSSRTIGTPSN